MATFFGIDGIKCFHCMVCRVDMPADEIYRLQNNSCKECFKRVQKHLDAKKYTKNKARKAIFEIFFSLEEKLQKARAQSEKQYKKQEKLLKKIEQEKKKMKEDEEKRRKLVEKYKREKAEKDEKIAINAKKIIDVLTQEFEEFKKPKDNNNDLPRYIAVEERERLRLEEYRKKAKNLAMAQNEREKQAEKYYAQYASEIVHQER